MQMEKMEVTIVVVLAVGDMGGGGVEPVTTTAKERGLLSALCVTRMGCCHGWRAKLSHTPHEHISLIRFRISESVFCHFDIACTLNIFILLDDKTM
jgi:hypothetical protein